MKSKSGEQDGHIDINMMPFAASSSDASTSATNIRKFQHRLHSQVAGVTAYLQNVMFF